MKIKEGHNIYIVRKYIVAKDVAHAIKLDKKTPVSEVWIDEEFKKTQSGASAIGFIDYRSE